MSIRELVTQHTLIKQIIDSICLETFSTVLGLVCITSKTMQNKHKLWTVVGNGYRQDAWGGCEGWSGKTRWVINSTFTRICESGNSNFVPLLVPQWPWKQCEYLHRNKGRRKMCKFGIWESELAINLVWGWTGSKRKKQFSLSYSMQWFKMYGRVKQFFNGYHTMLQTSVRFWHGLGEVKSALYFGARCPRTLLTLDYYIHRELPPIMISWSTHFDDMYFCDFILRFNLLG